MSNRDIVIQIRLPRWSRRTWTIVAVAVAALGGAVVWADVTWTQFMQNEKLTSGKLNDNFKAMADGITALQAGTVNYCGSVNIQNGNLGGYAAANKACQPACGNAATAHVCRTDEMIRVAASGANLPVQAVYAAGVGFPTVSGTFGDCAGFTSTGGQLVFSTWSNMTGPSPPINPGCASGAYPLLCCK